MPILTAIQGAATSAASSIRNALGLGMTELERQQLTGDSQFYQPYVAFFELVRGSTSYLYPMTFAPQQIQMQEPFSVQVTPTLDSHIFVEEGGVIQRRITLTGHTGFAPRVWTGSRYIPNNFGGAEPNYAPSSLPSTIVAALSGPRQFEYLRSVFRAYSDMKRDASTAKYAALYFHLPTVNEHFRVIPMSFSGIRSAQSPFTTPYQIDLMAVDAASPTVLPEQPGDKGWLKDFRDSVQATNHALGLLRGAVNDLTAVQGSFRILGGQVTAIIDNAASVVIAAENFLGGTSQIINLPIAAVSSLFNLCQQLVGTYAATVALGNQLADWPQAVVQRFRSLMTACDILLSHPESFVPPPDARLDALNGAMRQVIAGANAQPATSFADIQRNGSANLPGDALIAGAAPAPGPVPTFRSLTQVTIRQGDSLLSLAQFYLGDGRLWRAIALVNDIKPPLTGAQGRFYAYLEAAMGSDTGLLAAGQKIVVPQTAAPGASAASPGVLGAPTTSPPEERLLGRDMALVPASRSTIGSPIYDLDLSGGDIATVVGTDTVAQAVASQMTQPRGSNVLFPDVGLQAVIGTGLAQADFEMVRYRVQSALTQDPRVASVDRLNISQVGDTVVVDAALLTRGLDTSVPVRIGL